MRDDHMGCPWKIQRMNPHTYFVGLQCSSERMEHVPHTSGSLITKVIHKLTQLQTASRRIQPYEVPLLIYEPPPALTVGPSECTHNFMVRWKLQLGKRNWWMRFLLSKVDKSWSLMHSSRHCCFKWGGHNLVAIPSCQKPALSGEFHMAFPCQCNWRNIKFPKWCTRRPKTTKYRH